VLVGSQVSVSDIAQMPQDELVGIVCFQGSSLSHTAVLANALGIPAVVGVRELKGVYNGEPLIVDGFAGEVILQPNASVRREYRRLAAEEKQLR
jgi:signal transduction protein with GAF and PtsI domain